MSGLFLIWCAISRHPFARAARALIRSGKGVMSAYPLNVVLLTFGSMCVVISLLILGLNCFDRDEHHPHIDLVLILGASFGPLIALPLIAVLMRDRRQ